MASELLIYGATGHTGRLIVQRARALGFDVVLSGRSAEKLALLAEETGFPWRAASVDIPHALDTALTGVGVVLNAAGPFVQTAGPILDACLRVKAHYLDVTGEVRVIEQLARRHAEAKNRRIMVMPAVGFDVVPTDCLASHVVRRLPTSQSLAIAVTQVRFLSIGSARTLIESVDLAVTRRGGRLIPRPLGSIERLFDFGWGPTPCLNVALADLATAHLTTGVPTVETFIEATAIIRAALAWSRMLGTTIRGLGLQRWLDLWTTAAPMVSAWLPRDDVSMRIVAEVIDASGRRASARLRTPEAYAFTAMTAAEIASRACTGDVEIGFQTPGRLYGADFVLSFPGVLREDLA